MLRLWNFQSGLSELHFFFFFLKIFVTELIVSLMIMSCKIGKVKGQSSLLGSGGNTEKVFIKNGLKKCSILNEN